MLTIRPSQLDAFQEDLDRRFVARYTNLIRTRLEGTGYSWSGLDLDAATLDLIRRARLHGLDVDRDILAFILLGLPIARDFDEVEPFRTILADEALEPSMRIDALFDCATREDWCRAAMSGGKEH